MRGTLSACVAIAALSGVADAQSRPSFRTVAVTGDVVSGAPDLIMGGPGESSIDRRGEVSFLAPVMPRSGVGLPVNAVLSEGSLGIRPVALAGQVAPGSGGRAFTEFESAEPTLNPLHRNRVGSTLFFAYVDQSLPALDSGWWSDHSGQTRRAILAGEPAPEHEPEAFLSLEHHTARFNAQGQIAVRATTSVLPPGFGTSRNAIWVGRPRQLRTLARFGEVAPGTGGNTFHTFQDVPSLNDRGTVAFSALVQTPDPDVRVGGVFWGRPGDVHKSAAFGDPVPGFASTFLSFGSPTINNQNQVAFVAATRPNSQFGQSFAGVFTGSTTSFSAVARTGAAAPGTGGATFQAFSGAALLSEGGMVAFEATLSGAPLDRSSGLWRYNGTQTRLLARTGDAAPGADGATFLAIRDSVIDARGQVFFSGLLSGPDITPSNNAGVWVADVLGVPRIVAREGDIMRVAPGDHRVIENVRMPVRLPGADSRAPFVNDVGQITLSVRFTDGTSGVFVFHTPSPSGVATLLCGVMAITSRRRR